MKHSNDSIEYASQLAIQLKKGFLVYCVLLVCDKKAVYSSEIIRRLHDAKLVVVEGTLYPLLNRLQKDGLLTHSWNESSQGPPRKYYKSTDFGQAVLKELGSSIRQLNITLEQLKKG